MPGFDVRVVDDEGKEVGTGIMGNIVLAIPLAPTGLTTLFNDEERFYKGYLKRFSGEWVDTGDAGIIDEDGYVHVMSRSDDIINVAAHRFSTGKASPSKPRILHLDRLIMHRVHRTSHLLPPHDYRVLCRRCPRRAQRSPPFRLRHPIDARPPDGRCAVGHAYEGNPTARPRTDRRHCCSWWDGAGSRHDPQDAEWEDVTEVVAGIGGKCGARGV